MSGERSTVVTLGPRVASLSLSPAQALLASLLLSCVALPYAEILDYRAFAVVSKTLTNSSLDELARYDTAAIASERVDTAGGDRSPGQGLERTRPRIPVAP